MTNVLIIEDEPPAARRLISLTTTHLPGAATIHATSLDAAYSHLSQKAFEIVTLDLNLQGADGFCVLDRLSKEAAVIVVSAHEERALEAFEHGVVDFVPKPVASERFKLALTRAQEKTGQGVHTIPLRTPKGIDIVSIDNIVAISALDNYAEIFMQGGKSYIEDRSLADLETSAKGKLIRAHRSHLVNPLHIKEMFSNGGGTNIRLTDGICMPVSRRNVSVVKAVLRPSRK